MNDPALLPVFPYFAKIEIPASQDFRYRIKLPKYPFRAAAIKITSDQALDIGGTMFNRVRVIDDLNGGEHKHQPDIDGTITLGGIAGTFMEFREDVLFQGTNLSASTANVLIQFLQAITE